jgi:hypothetical protein
MRHDQCAPRTAAYDVFVEFRDATGDDLCERFSVQGLPVEWIA